MAISRNVGHKINCVERDLDGGTFDFRNRGAHTFACAASVPFGFPVALWNWTLLQMLNEEIARIFERSRWLKQRAAAAA